MNIDIALNHYTVNAPYVAEISKPFESIGLIGFVYMRIYPNGSIINLAALPCWTDFYYKQVFAKNYTEQDMIDHLCIHDGASLWAMNPANKVWKDVKDKFGYGNGITLNKQHDEFKEITMFYSMADNHAINNFYLNNLDILNKFKNYFIESAHKIIKQEERVKDSFCHPLIPTKNPKTSETSLIENLTLDISQKLKSIGLNTSQLTWDTIFKLSATQINKLLVKRNYPINLGTHQITLSKMEIRTFIELIKGKHAGEIACTLEIKQSTVESYLLNLKNKIGVNFKSELISYILEHQLLQKIVI